ncbi:uncharacterized protein LOC130450935 isoform X1 [Diorhabda sublineata]|uniref:uncharacterized protein LOC130450935 isoform X1 n=1 Tax=Diorhabda sublineata TaxID=1163346 RepID=UPI0024E169EA|nr:uncharacterized protein LOC130450935 isoform X1 [Diorhabda sublineata]
MIPQDILMVLILYAVSLLPEYTKASCYFPQEFQGEFAMQSTTTPYHPSPGIGIQYSTLNITENSIPIWGNCHRRIGNNFILMFNYSETLCVRCLHLKLRSSNVLQIFAATKEPISKCFINEEAAEANCPSEDSLQNKESTEILLFKTKDNFGLYTSTQYCPMDGNYILNYKGTSRKSPNECKGYVSVANSCPSGSELNVRLRNCTFEGYDMKFECLGHWKGNNGEIFVIFTDSRHTKNLRPKYRCAVYKRDPTTGKIQMALSRDSTCITDLHNITSGFETFSLTPRLERPWPAEVSFESCSFPQWMYGDWEHVNVTPDTMIYKDHTSFKTHTIKCVAVSDAGDKYLVFSRTQCDEEYYNCVKIANRGGNILEFQLGTNTSTNKDDVFTLCANENFQPDSWITQGRLEIPPTMSSEMCPITGEYTGRIPDATDLCAKLWSDCRAPEYMYYQVSHCETEEIYEEREYQCLGHWREKRFLYTYTARRDVAAGTYECFVGSIFSETEIFIKEAGEHCQRNVDPSRYGMKLIKKQPLYSCIEKSTTPRLVPRTTTKSARRKTTAVSIKETTPIPDIESNDIPDIPKEETNHSGTSSIISQLPVARYLLSIILIFVYFYN